MRYFHGTVIDVPIGFVLKPQENGYVNKKEVSELEALFEASRPNECISRINAVFVSSDADLIDPAGGYTDVIYEVDPLGDVQHSDLAWYTEAQCYLEDGLITRAAECAHNYWIGVPYPDAEMSCFEILCCSAEVESVYELNVSKTDLHQLPTKTLINETEVKSKIKIRP